MPKPTPEDILLRWKESQTRKHRWTDLYGEAQEYATPQTENIAESSYSSGYQQTAGDIDNDRNFTGFVEDAADGFASRMFNTMFPVESKWVNYEHMTDPANEGIRDIIMKIQDKTEQVLASGESNFQAQMTQAFLDIVIGTACILCREHNEGKPILFEHIPLSQFSIEETAEGLAENIFRYHELPLRAWEELFPGFDWTQVSAPDAAKSVRIKCIESCIYVPVKPGHDDPDAGYFYHTVVTQKNKLLVHQEKFETNPWIVFRWSKHGGEIWGRGPAIKQLPDIRLYNYLASLHVHSAEWNALRVFTVSDDRVFNQENFAVTPGAQLAVRSNSPSSPKGRSIEPLPAESRMDQGLIVMEELKRSIEEAMLKDDLGPVDQPTKSPLEVSIRQRQLLKRIGQSFGRMQDELIIPLMRRVLHVLFDSGQFDDIIAETEGDSKEFKKAYIDHMVYKPPVSLLSKQQQLTSFEEFFRLIQGYFGPEALLMVTKPAEISQYISRTLNLPSDVINSAEEIKENLQKAQEAAQQAQQAGAAGGGASGGGGAPTSGAQGQPGAG